ncbi:MAG: YbhN family protein [Lachnospirales bacterium]
MKNKKTIIESGVLIVLLALTLSFLLRNQDLTEIIDIIRNSNPFFVFLSFLSMALYVFCGGYEVNLFLRQRGYKLSIFKCFKYSFTEIFFSAITPSSTGGQPMMAISMRNDGCPLTESTPALIAITGIYKFGLMVLGIIFCLLFGNEIFMSSHSWVFVLFVLGFLLNAVVVLCVWLLLFSNRCIWYIFKFFLIVGCGLKIIKNREKTEAFFKTKKAQYVECANYLKNYPFVVLKVFLLCILQRLAISFVAVFVYKALGMEAVSFMYILAIQIILALTVEILPLPGAVGVSETVFLSMYLSIYGTPELLNAGLLLTRGISFYILFIFSAVFVNLCYVSGIIKDYIKRGEYK